MEINKVLLTDSVLLNNFGTSNKTEKTASESKSVSYTDEVDESSEIVQSESKKSKKKKKTETVDTTAKEENIRSQKGTTYIVVGKDGCGRCKTFENEVLDTLKNNLSGKANFMELDCDTEDSLTWQLKKEAGDNSSSYGLPAIIKVVDGKAVEFMQYKDFGNFYKNADKMTEFLEDKIATEASDKTTTTKKTSSTKTSSTKTGQINKTTSKNVKENLYNQKGTTFVEITGKNCSICKGLEPYLKNAAKELGDSANFISVTNEEDETLFWKLLREAGYTEKSAPIPMMIKYVDGKPVEIMKRNDLTGHKKNLAEYLGKKVEKADERKADVETKNATETSEEDCPECQIKADDEPQNEGNAKDTAELVAKKKLETMKENLQIMNNFVQEITTDALENAIENASSISDLKDVVNNYSTGLDFNLQLNLQSAVDSLNEDTDLKKAKEQLLAML